MCSESICLLFCIQGKFILEPVHLTKPDMITNEMGFQKCGRGLIIVEKFQATPCSRAFPRKLFQFPACVLLASREGETSS